MMVQMSRLVDPLQKNHTAGTIIPAGEPDRMRPLFVFVKCALTETYRVAEAIVDRIPQTAEIFSVSGDWDILCRFNLEEGSDIGRFVTETVQAVPGVRETSTLVGFRMFGERDPLGPG